MTPWWQDFEGVVMKNDDNNYEIHGNYNISGNKMIITELPVGEWTSNYKEFLEKMLEDAPIKNTKNTKTKKTTKKPAKVEKNPFLSYKDNRYRYKGSF
jgi:DNA topoisomerase-2